MSSTIRPVSPVITPSRSSWRQYQASASAWAKSTRSVRLSTVPPDTRSLPSPRRLTNSGRSDAAGRRIGIRSCGNSGAGHVIELPDGGVLMPLCGTISNDDTTSPVGETGRSFLLRSDDAGDHWEHWATIAYDPAHIIHFHEPGVTRLHDGRLIALLRVSRRPNRYDNLWFAWSDDDGASWSRPRRTNIWGYPADVTQLQDGRVLAVYGYRRPPWGVRGCVSEDGVTWDVANEFVIRQGGAAAPEVPFYWHIGYPSVAQTPDGTIVAAYHELSDDPRPVQFICCTRFHLS